ncbi:MAG: copper resistance protein CopC [Hyphomicrobium sp.]|nr:copper resistance protein CopC [Hyphomicrobium sp.]
MRAIRSVAFAAILIMGGVTAALAHAKMNASVPKSGETVAAGLSEIQLHFSKPLRLTLIHVRRVDDQQEMAVSSELPASFVGTPPRSPSMPCRLAPMKSSGPRFQTMTTS